MCCVLSPRNFCSESATRGNKSTQDTAATSVQMEQLFLLEAGTATAAA